MVDRFGQIEPKVLFCADGYLYGGKEFDSQEKASQVLDQLPSVEECVVIDYLGAPAWHYTDEDGMTKKEFKTWSVWRGYGAVRTIKGDGADGRIAAQLDSGAPQVSSFRDLALSGYIFDGDFLDESLGVSLLTLAPFATGLVPLVTLGGAVAGCSLVHWRRPHLAGRRERGHARRRVKAAVGHATFMSRRSGSV